MDAAHRIRWKLDLMGEPTHSRIGHMLNTKFGKT